MSDSFHSEDVKPPLLFLWGPVAFWCGVIFVLSSIPDLGTGLGIWDLYLRKAAHATEYVVLAALFWRALSKSKPFSLRALFWTTLIFCALYAVSDEWHQGFVPGRTPSAMDVSVDTLGALSACFLQRCWGADAFSYLRSRFLR